MSDDTQVKPMTPNWANEIRVFLIEQLPRTPIEHEKYPAGRALDAIADGRHEVIDKATHAAVEHTELERLRACEADARRLDFAERYIADIEFQPVSHDHMRQPDGYVRRVTFTHARNGTDEGPEGETFRDAIDLSIAAIDADQQLAERDKGEYTEGWEEGFFDAQEAQKYEAESPPHDQLAERGEPVADIPDYDAGSLNDWGGGNVDWWQDYLRAEIERCNEHWRSRMEDLAPPAQSAGLRKIAEDMQSDAERYRGDHSGARACVSLECYASELLRFLSAAPSAGEAQGDSMLQARRDLALAYSGGALYGDDGELSDCAAQPFIDFRRDSFSEIGDKLRRRTEAQGDGREAWRLDMAAAYLAGLEDPDEWADWFAHWRPQIAEMLTEDHCGDCTDAPMTCSRCLAEKAVRAADAAIAAQRGGE